MTVISIIEPDRSESILRHTEVIERSDIVLQPVKGGFKIVKYRPVEPLEGQVCTAAELVELIVRWTTPRRAL